MKTLLRVLFTALVGLAAPALFAGNLKVNLAPTAAVTAGAQWRVDGGVWRNSGAQVNGLSNTTHTVDYKTVSGWIAPASTPVSISGGTTTTITGTYVQAASLKITLTPSSGQWRIDGGAWQTSGVTLANLTPGSHAITYAALTGYAAPAGENVMLTSGQTTTLSRSYTQLAQLAVTLTPGTAQWRVDGGAWQSSGTTVSNLSVGTHTVDYAALAGYSAPSSESVTLASGQLLTLNRGYVQLAQVTVTLSPSNAQWRIDGGAWQASGATVANLSPGSHTIDYSALPPSWGTPPAESVTLSAGQSLALTRTYTQLGQVLIALVPSNGQWRLNGGAWQASGTSLWVPSGTYTADYSTIADYDAPPSDTFTNGFAATRYYTSTKPTLRVTTSPATGQWRLDGGAWQASGAQLTELTTGSHTIDYTDVGGDYNPLASETISLALREHASLSRIYSLKPATLTVNLTPANAQWLLTGPMNTGWHSSGDTVTGLVPGSYTIQYAPLPNYTTPANEAITLAPQQVANVTRNYAPLPASLRVRTDPASGQWRTYPVGSTPGTTWNASGFVATGLAAGDYVVEFAPLSGYNPLPSETVTLTPNQAGDIFRTYVSTTAQLSVLLNPSSAQWRFFPVNTPPSGTWQTSGVLSGLAPGDYTIEYGPVAGYATPLSQNFTLVAGGTTYVGNTYVRLAQVTINLTPAAAQWRIDGGAWQAAGATLANVALGWHSIDYLAINGYTAPASESVTLTEGQSLVLTRDYTPLAQVTVTLTPASGQWRIDGGAWNMSGATVGNLAAGNHSIEYLALANYVPPAAETITLASGQSATLARSHTPLPAQITVNLTPPSGQWRIYPAQQSPAGTWQSSGARVLDLAPGDYVVEYSAVANYDAPAAETLTLAPNQSATLTRTYAAHPAQASITLTPASGQWRIYATGNTPPTTWQASGATVGTLPPGNYTVDYASLSGYTALHSETFALAAGQSLSLSRAYSAQGQVTVTTSPSTGQWRLVEASPGPWKASGATVTGLDTPASYQVEYLAVTGYTTPMPTSFSLAAGESKSLSANYTPIPGRLKVVLNPATAQFRIDGGAWNPSGATMSGGPSTFQIEFSDEPGYTTPAPITESLALGDDRTITINYGTVPLPQLKVNLTPSAGQWRIDGGAWQASGATLTNLSIGQHQVEFSAQFGYQTPAPVTLTLAGGENRTLAQTYYVGSASLRVTLDPTVARWRTDGGAWIPSSWVEYFGSGPHLLEFEPVAGYATPPAENLTLAVDENRVLTRSYTQLPQAKLTINLTPASAQWRIYSGATPGGTWNNSGASLAGIEPGTYTIQYAPVANYGTPPSEQIVLSAFQVATLNRSYTSYLGDVTITLTPGNAQWRISPWAGPSDPTWHDSGTTVSGLPAGDYFVEYSSLTDYLPLYNERITLGSAQSLAITRTYRHVYQVSVSLYPSTAQWRIDAGPWIASGDGAWNLTPGAHTIDYSNVSGYVAPPSESVTIDPNASPISFYRYYTPLAQLTVNFYPSSGRWRVDGGAWLEPGATATNLVPDVSHLVEYAATLGYVAPPSETVTLYSGQQMSIYRYYASLAQLTVNFYPSTGRWRIDNGPWLTPGTTVPDLAFDVPHTIDYQATPGYVAPPSETVTLYSGQQLSIYRYYASLAQLTVNFYPSTGRWRIDGGDWLTPGTTAPNLAFDVPHTVDYQAVAGYVAPASETVTLYSGQQQTIYRSYSQLPTVSVTTSPATARWRLDGGAWQASGATVMVNDPNVSHLIEYEPVRGYATPSSQTISLYYSQQYTAYGSYYSLGTHRLRFFLHQDLVGSLTVAELRSRIQQYVTHLLQVHDRETQQLITFDPADISVVTSDPFSGYASYPPGTGFEMWVYASLTDDPATGTYGGSVGLDYSGAGGATGLKWDQIYDPSTLTDGSPQLAQYWRQLHGILRQFEGIYGVGLGGYDSVGGLKDLSGVAPILPDVASATSAAADSFWTARFDYWTDPATANAYANPRLGSPTSLPTLLNLVSFAPVSRTLINQTWRWTPGGYEALPDMAHVAVKVVDAQTNQPIPGATLRVWNRQSLTPPATTYEETVATTSAGVFQFSWTGGSSTTNTATNAKVLKAFAPGYAPAAEWRTLFDAQTAAVVNNQWTWEIVIPLTHQ